MDKGLSKNIYKKLIVAIVSILIISIVASLFITNLNAALADNKSKFLGNIMKSYAPDNFGEYWNQVTPENATKWGSVEGTRNKMNWSGADVSFNYAKKNNIPFKFHTLVWGSQEPGWVKNLSANEQKKEVIQWYDAAAAKFKNCEMIDVVNEPLHAKPSYKNAIGGDGSTGWDWVIWSFEEARKRFNGKLILNDYGIVNDANATNKYLKIINLLKDRNLIDGIGCQAHTFNVENYSTSVLKSNLDKLAATGIPIYISELDLSGDDQTQLNHYKQKFPVFWEHPGVAGITLWGYIQGETWKANTGLVSSRNSNANERPALKWLKEYLGNSNPTTNSTTNPPATTKPPVTTTKPPVNTTKPPSANGISATTSVVNDWGSGGILNIIITNNGNTATNGWSTTINVPGNISSIWGAKGSGNGKVTISNVAWNSVVQPGNSIEAGLVYNK